MSCCRVPVALAFIHSSARASISASRSATCTRDADPQKCYLGPGNGFHRNYNSTYFWGPKNNSWGRNREEGQPPSLRTREPPAGAGRRPLPRGSPRRAGAAPRSSRSGSRRRPRAARSGTAARKVLGWPKICKLAHAFLQEYSYKRLKLAQLLGQFGVFLTCSPAFQTARQTKTSLQCRSCACPNK